jgi:hypothetical protein
MHFQSLRSQVTLGLAAMLIAGALAAPAHAEPQYQVHGFFSQGFAMSTDHELLGIPTSGTTDWRRAAIQLRLIPTDQDQLVLQLRERRLGTSPVSAQGDENIALDWAFAQRSVGQFAFRAGRMPLARGIYNQVRDVGIINPFYRAPYMFYTESFETVEGAQVSAERELGHGWSGDVALFGGETYYRDFNPTDATQLLEGRAQRVFGGQLWLATPLQGARIGINHTSFAFNQQKYDVSQYSFDGNFERFMLRGEYGYLGGAALKRPGYYGQAGVQLHPKVWVYGMYEKTQSRLLVPGLPSPPFPPGIGPFWSPTYDMSKDLAGSIVVKPSSALALKLEAHSNEGFNFPVSLQPFPIQPPGYPVFVPASDPLKTTYVIASVSIAY